MLRNALIALGACAIFAAQPAPRAAAADVSLEAMIGQMVMVGFVGHSLFHLEPSLVALLGAGALVALSRLEPQQFLEDVEWATLVFFAALFVMVGALVEVKGLVEKPKQGAAPSNIMIPGRYILQPEVMRILETQEKGAGGEIQLTDAMRTLMDRQPFFGVQYEGQSFDCGSKIGFLSANIAFALERDDIRKEFLAELAARNITSTLVEAGGLAAAE